MGQNPRYDCAIDAAMSVIEGRWKCTIVCLLSNNGSMRYNELLRKIGQISSRMLSKQLKELEKDNIVSRNVDDDASIKISYSLTDKGKTLIPVLKTLAKWGLEHEFPNRVDINTD